MDIPVILPSDENAKYPCTQNELYAVCEFGWKNHKRNQAAFSNFSPVYTPGYADERIAEIIAAEHLPDEQSRDEVRESARALLVRAAEIALGKWQDLKRYILKAYPEDLQKGKLEAAGSTYYRTAQQENWDVLKGMLNTAQDFIATYLADLTANNNMPPTFQNSFSTAKTEFETTYGRFFEAEEGAQLGTGIKVGANNTIFFKLMSMLEDGQAIFRTNDRMAKLFTFDHILGLVSSPGAAGIKGIILNAVTEQPVAGATVAIPAQNKSAVTDDKGEYLIEKIRSGDISITVSAAGYTPRTFIEKVPEGVVHTIDIVISNV